MDSGFRVLDSGCYPYRFRISKHKRFQILVPGLLLIFAFRFLEMTSMADLVIEGHVNVCLFVYISITTFDNYKIYNTAN